MRKTKIVCTLGPASSEDDIMRQMLLAGLDVARVNFSHGDHEGHGKVIDRFRRVRDDLGKAAAVMLDTKGPEIRTGNFKEGKVMLEAGQLFTLTSRDVEGDCSCCSITYKMLPAEVKEGDVILIDDGKIRLTVKETTAEDIVCTVMNPGPVSNHKGINVPKVRLSMDYLSPADKSDLLFGIEKDVDYVAASFVRKADDVRDLRRFWIRTEASRSELSAKLKISKALKISRRFWICRTELWLPEAIWV